MDNHFATIKIYTVIEFVSETLHVEGFLEEIVKTKCFKKHIEILSNSYS